MKVGLTLYGSLDERSGGFRYDRKLIEQLRRAGDELEIIELPWRSYHRGLLDNVSRELRDRLDVAVDVMLQDELAHPSLVATNRSLSYPVVSIVHHLRASEQRRLSPLYRALERQYLTTVDGVVCTSTVTRDVVTALDADPESTVVAPPAGDRFDPAISENTIERRAYRGPLKVVFVGNIIPRKGLDTLVDGLAQAETPAELTVVGRQADDAYVSSVRQRIEATALTASVELVGELTDTALASVLQSSHVLAVPSHYEGLGIVYLEAMSFGLPVLATRAGGATDIVTEGETGYLLAPDDPMAVATALNRLGNERDRLATMGCAARRRYEQQPDWEESASRVRQLLADIATRPTVSS